MPRASLAPVLLLAAVTLGAVLVAPGFVRAADPAKENVYLHVSGYGPNAKAWYKGAPPAGTPVQDALDHFNSRGFRVSHTTDITLPSFTLVVNQSGTEQRIPTDFDPFYVVFMEK
jgi:hypothetical protein